MTGNRWIWLALTIALAIGVSRANAFAVPDTRPATEPSIPVDSFQRLVQGLNTGTPESRYDAAQRLIAINSPAARAAIGTALGGRDDRAQFAAAQAAAEAISPDKAWITPLQKLLARDHDTADAAARALARYDEQPDASTAVNALIETARSKQPGQIPAINAMGHVVQKRAAEVLISLAADPSESSAVREAAMDSLARMSGQNPGVTDAVGWGHWFDSRKTLPDDQWRSQVIAEQHRFLEFSDQRANDHVAALRKKLYDMVSAQYHAQAASRRSDELLGFLNDPDPDIRAAGAALVPDAVNTAQTFKQNVIERLESLLGDPSPEVRIEVAVALYNLSDANALAAVVSQLRVESDIRAKKALIQTLVKCDTHAVPTLQRLLDDPSESVAGAAADALANMPALQSDPQALGTVFTSVKQMLNNRTGPPGQPKAGSADLRAKLLLALAATSKGGDADDNAMFFQTFLTLDEPPVVRQAALIGLGSTGDRGGPAISQELNPGIEPDPEVRRQAAITLGTIKSFAWAQRLDESSRRPAEQSQIVQEAAWQSFQKIMPFDDPGELLHWADKFKARGQFDREIIAIKVACQKITNPQSLAVENQTLGDIYTDDLNSPAEAIPYYRDALKYIEDQKKSQPELVRSLLKAYLAAGKYAEAITFSREQLQMAPRTKDEIGPVLANWAYTLTNSNDPVMWDQARKLVAMAEPLELDYLDKNRLQQALSRRPLPTTGPAH